MSKGKDSTPSVDLEAVTPSRVGRDLRDKHGIVDGHIRVETYKGIGTRIYVDLFDSKIEDVSEAHIASESFPKSVAGADEATAYLADNGLQVAIVMG